MSIKLKLSYISVLVCLFLAACASYRITDKPESKGGAPEPEPKEKVEPFSIDAEPKVADIGQAIRFFGKCGSEAPEATIHWEFGDGQTAEGDEANHAYSSSGSYVAKGQCINPDGSSGPSGEIAIQINPKAGGNPGQNGQNPNQNPAQNPTGPCGCFSCGVCP